MCNSGLKLVNYSLIFKFVSSLAVTSTLFISVEMEQSSNMSDLDPIHLIFWSFPIALLLYYTGDLITTVLLTRKNNDHPLVGSPSKWTPRVLLNLIFAANATELLQDGYRRVIYPQMISNIFLASNCLLVQISHIPTDPRRRQSDHSPTIHSGRASHPATEYRNWPCCSRARPARSLHGSGHHPGEPNASHNRPAQAHSASAHVDSSLAV